MPLLKGEGEEKIRTIVNRREHLLLRQPAVPGCAAVLRALFVLSTQAGWCVESVLGTVCHCKLIFSRMLLTQVAFTGNEGLPKLDAAATRLHPHVRLELGRTRLRERRREQIAKGCRSFLSTNLILRSIEIYLLHNANNHLV